MMPRLRSTSEEQPEATTPRTSRKRDAEQASSSRKRPRKESAPLSESRIREICRRVWTEVRQYKNSSGRVLSKLFQTLPSKQEYPDYYEVIEQPIALNQIKANLDAGKYTTIEAFKTDMLHMFANARKYNVRGSQVYADSQTLQKLTLRLLAEELGEEGSISDHSGDEQSVASSTDGKRRLRSVRSKSGQDGEEEMTEEEEMDEEEEEEEEEEEDEMEIDDDANEDDYVEPTSTRTQSSKDKRKGKSSTSSGGGRRRSRVKEEEYEKPKRPKSARLLREILESITEYRDETGRRLAEPFMELPTEERFPGYFKKVRRLASFNKIENRIKRGYDSFERYERECMRVLDNAMLYFDKDQQEYKDAAFLKELLAKNIVAIITKYENCSETPAGIDPRIKLDLTGRVSVESVTYKDQTYSLGEFVYVHDHRDIMIIDRIYKHAEKEPLMIGRFFARPERLPAAYGRRVVEHEVYKTLLSRDFTASDIRGKCYVMPLRDFYHCYPTDFPEEDVYVCNNRYSERATRPFPYIGDWKRSIGVDIYRKVRMTQRPTPIRPQKYTLVDENTRPPVSTATSTPAPAHRTTTTTTNTTSTTADEDELEFGATSSSGGAVMDGASTTALTNNTMAVGMNQLGLPFLPAMSGPAMFVPGQMPLLPATMNMNQAAYGQLTPAHMMMATPGMLLNQPNSTLAGNAMDTTMLAAGTGYGGVPAEVRSAGELVAALSGRVGNAQTNGSNATGSQEAQCTIELPPGTSFLAEIIVESEDPYLCYHLDLRHTAHSLHVQEPVQTIVLRPQPSEILLRNSIGPSVFVYQNARLVPPDPNSVVSTSENTTSNNQSTTPAATSTASDTSTPSNALVAGAKAGTCYRMSLLPGLNALEVWASVPGLARTATGKPELQQFSLFITKS